MTRRSPAAPAAPPTIPKIPPTQVLSRLAALQAGPTATLKEQWRELFGKEPPPWNRAYIQSRLAYRIQELAYGGLKPETVDRLVALGEQLDGGNVVLRRIRADSRPLAGTRLIREWQGVQLLPSAATTRQISCSPSRSSSPSAVTSAIVPSPRAARTWVEFHQSAVSTQRVCSSITFHSRRLHKNCAGPSSSPTRPWRTSIASSYLRTPNPREHRG